MPDSSSTLLVTGQNLLGGFDRTILQPGVGKAFVLSHAGTDLIERSSQGTESIGTSEWGGSVRRRYTILTTITDASVGATTGPRREFALSKSI